MFATVSFKIPGGTVVQAKDSDLFYLFTLFLSCGQKTTTRVEHPLQRIFSRIFAVLNSINENGEFTGLSKPISAILLFNCICVKKLII